MQPVPSLATRPPAVAGAFYPEDPGALRQQVMRFLDKAAKQTGLRGNDRAPKAIIAPHAGYAYSGECAAQAHALFLPERETITRLVLLGPCHRVAVKGLATTSAQTWRTPAGHVAIDRLALEAVADLPQVDVNDEAHAAEHSLEVHLPFLQAVLPDFELAPFAVGDASAAEIAEVMARLWGGPETRFVISSDLSHYLGYDEGRGLDEETARSIEAFDGSAIRGDQACGRVPVGGLLRLGKDKGLAVQRVALCSSGDTAGSKDRVVGYGAWAFDESDDKALARTHGKTLMGVIGEAIKQKLKRDAAPKLNLNSFPLALRYHRATFITLVRDGKLRGCRGTLSAQRPLVEDVALNALSSAFDDPRFPPLSAEELEGLGWSISLLTPATPMAVADEADLLEQLVPGEDGLIIRDKEKQATFLPQVWQSLPEPGDFLAQLRKKAGLSADHWSETFEVRRYRATKIG